MPPKNERPDKNGDDLAAQLREMQLNLENMQSFISNQLPSMIREQLTVVATATHTQPPPYTPKPPKIHL